MTVLYSELAYDLLCDCEFHFVRTDDGEICNVGRCDCVHSESQIRIA